MNNLLFDESPLIILPELAVRIGLNEAIILQQIHYWLQKSNNIKDGKKWVYKTIKEWCCEFPFWGKNTIIRTRDKLIADGIVIIANYNQKIFDKTLWYSIDYVALNAKLKFQLSKYPIWVNEIPNMGNVDIPNMGKPIPKTTYTETTTENMYGCKNAYATIILAYTQDEKLTEVIYEFIKMRKLIKKPLTDKALKLNLNKLDKLTPNIPEKIQILEQSIANCYQGIFAIKDDYKNTYKTSTKTGTMRDL